MMRTGRLAAVAAAGALALAGCGGGDGDGAEAPSASTAGTPPPAAPGTTTEAAARPTLAASQELVDLVNEYASSIAGASGADLGPDELKQRAERLRAGSTAVVARVGRVVAHPCVERLAIGQASLMGTLADFFQAAAEGRAGDAAAHSQELIATDQAAMLRESQACQAQVGYRGPQAG